MSERAPAGPHGEAAEEHEALESNRLGMWIFLATEILLFGGLFCAYAVYRSNHPEIFIYAHRFLSKTLGGINTAVLIGSSFTMAWAVRSAQIGDRKRLPILLGITLLCGFCFLGIKAIEYQAKWKHGLLWGQHYKPVAHEGTGASEGTYVVPGGQAAPGTPAAPGASEAPHAPGAAAPTAQQAAQAAPAPAGSTATSAQQAASAAPTAQGAPAAPTAQGAPAAPTAQAAPGAATAQQAAQSAASLRDSTRSLLPLAALEPGGLAAEARASAPRPGEEPQPVPRNVQIFFSIYFAMTGLHALHVIVGMALIGIMLGKALRGEIGPRRFTGVDNVGLYWHLVDVIWIYLFPLLYLIR